MNLYHAVVVTLLSSLHCDWRVTRDASVMQFTVQVIRTSTHPLTMLIHYATELRVYVFGAKIARNTINHPRVHVSCACSRECSIKQMTQFERFDSLSSNNRSQV